MTHQSDDTDGTIMSWVVVSFSVLATILFLHLFVAQIESIVRPGGNRILRRYGWATTEQGQWSAERRRQHVCRIVEKRARAGAGQRSQVEGLSSPGSAAGELGVVLELHGEASRVAVIAELWEWM